MSQLKQSLLDMWYYLEKGGIMMIPLAICSILGLAIILVKLMQLRRKNVIFPEIVNVIQNIQNPTEVDFALKVCKSKPGSFANVIQTGLQNMDLPIEEIKETVLDRGRQEIRVLERGLVALETIAGVAPLLGLLGTVLGMLKVFNELSKSEVVHTSQFSSGIYEALITTVVGLFIGIPALVFYNYLIDKAEAIILEIESFSAELIYKLARFQKRSTPAKGEPDAVH